MLITTDDNPSNLGYFMIDQRATGLPVSNGRPLLECATYTCTHCERVVMMNQDRQRPRYKCFGCHHLICDPCAAEKAANGGRCVTYQQKLAEIHARETAQGSGDGSIILAA